MNNLEKNKLIAKMGENLPTLRIRLSLTQAKLAEMVGISRQTLVAIESGKRAMSWNTFLSCLLIFQNNSDTRKLLSVYDISTDELNEYLSCNSNKVR